MLAYPFKKSVKNIMAIVALHNFIWRQNSSDDIDFTNIVMTSTSTLFEESGVENRETLSEGVQEMIELWEHITDFIMSATFQ